VTDSVHPSRPFFFVATKASTESTPAFAGRGSRRRSNGRLTHWTSVRKGTSQGLDFRPSTINGRTPSIVLGPKVLAGARNLSLAVVGNYYDRQGAQPILALATASLLWTFTDNQEQPGPVWDPPGSRTGGTVGPHLHWFTIPEGHFSPPNRVCGRGRSTGVQMPSMPIRRGERTEAEPGKTCQFRFREAVPPPWGSKEIQEQEYDGGGGAGGGPKLGGVKNPLFLARAPTTGHPCFGSLLEPSGINRSLFRPLLEQANSVPLLLCRPGLHGESGQGSLLLASSGKHDTFAKSLTVMRRLGATRSMRETIAPTSL